jgi:pimeloyl-ACP methyl ester carboxylesterase
VFVSCLRKQRAPEKRDYVPGYRKLLALPLILAVMGLAHPGSARGQANALSEGGSICFIKPTHGMACQEPKADQAAEAALRLVSFQSRAGTTKSVGSTIVIGFVGGFVRSDDVTHPEVQFAALLRESYPSIVHADVFANHDGKNALRQVLHLLDTDGDGVLTAGEKQQASIIIYGHSWGAAQAVTLARELGRLDIPVSLTILVDRVHKPGHDDAVIPPNVRNVVNFYQTRGFIHGRSRIRASDPVRTHVGNFQMTYQDRQINCDNYPWIARHLNKPHHEIENDPLVWKEIASIIDSELSKSRTVEASFTSTSVVK